MRHDEEIDCRGDPNPGAVRLRFSGDRRRGGATTTGIGLTGISLAFGISCVAVAYGLGAISEAHLNLVGSLGALLAGRMEAAEFGGYVVAQVIGAIIGSGSCTASLRAP